MKKIIITEDDEGVVEIEQYYKGPHAFNDWELLETEEDVRKNGGIVGFTRLLHRGNREIKMKHMKAKRVKK